MKETMRHAAATRAPTSNEGVVRRASCVVRGRPSESRIIPRNAAGSATARYKLRSARTIPPANNRFEVGKNESAAIAAVNAIAGARRRHATTSAGTATTRRNPSTAANDRLVYAGVTRGL